jgi:hypothetical protein
MMFFKNKLVNMPDRELVYTPYNAIILDFTEKYVSSKTYNELKERVEYLEERDDELSRLEAYGVDNWCGYDEAMSDSMGIFE